MPKILSPVLVFLLAAVAAGDDARDEVDPLAELVRIEETVVTPARRSESRFPTPYSLDTVEAAGLSGARAPRSLPDALAEVPGVMMQRTGYGQGSPYIRGLTGFRTLLLVDGIRLNNSAFRDGPNQYLSTVDHLSLGGLELVRGPGAVLYGSDSMGGTVNLLPHRPVLVPGGDIFGGRVLARLASAEQSVIGRIDGYGSIGGEFAFVGGISRKVFGDLRAGDGKLDGTGYDEWDGDLAILFAPTSKLEITLGYQRASQDDVPRTHKTMDARSWHGTTVGGEARRDLDQIRDLLYLRTRIRQPLTFIEELTLTASWQHHREVQYRVRSDGRSDRQGFRIHTLGFSLEATSETAAGTFSYGVDYYRDSVDSFLKSFTATGSLRSTGIQGPVGDDAVYSLAGVYVQDAIDIQSDLTLTAGGRATWAAVDANSTLDPLTGEETGIDDSWRAVVGSIRATWTGIEDVAIYGGVSQGFRAPNLSDLTRLDSARSDEIETPSPDLDPERSLSFDLGGRLRSGPLELELSVFHTVLDDLIQRFPTGTVIDGDNEVTKANIGDGYVRGVEVGGRVDVGGGFTIFGSGALLDGRADNYPTSARVKEDEYLDRLPPLMGEIGLRWRGDEGLLLSGRIRMADKADRLSTRDAADTERIPPGGTPGYGVVDLSASIPLADRATITFGLENLFDKAYRIHGSGQNQPGRNFTVTLEIGY